MTSRTNFKPRKSKKDVYDCEPSFTFAISRCDRSFKCLVSGKSQITSVIHLVTMVMLVKQRVMKHNILGYIHGLEVHVPSI